MPKAGENVFLFVIWSAARPWEAQITEGIEKQFKVLRVFDVTWSKRFFAQNLAAFYGWKSWHVWRNKARKCGTGPFRVIVVEDPAPVWKHERDTFGHEMLVDENVYRLKKSFRALTGRSNIVHSSVTAEETAHQLAALDSSAQTPIPFRKMIYEDDARIRRARRLEWMNFAVDVFTPFVVSSLVCLAVWMDVSVLGTNCAENRLVEWGGLLLSALNGILMAVCAVRQRAARSVLAIFAAFFLDLVVLEADQILDEVLGPTLWKCVGAVITLVFGAVMARYAKTLHLGLHAVRSSRFFSLFACGATLVLFVSQCLGWSAVWSMLGVTDVAGVGHFVEECVELFGYGLMTVWAMGYFWKTFVPCVDKRANVV